MNTWSKVASVAAMVALLVGACGVADAADASNVSKRLRVEGSTTVGPIADAFKEVFKRTHKNVDISISKSGSGTGAKAMVEGKCEIAMMSRFMKTKEFKKAVDNGVMPVAHVVAMDGVCVIVHPSNPVKALSSEQIRAIYTGEITNWKQLNGPDRKIVAVSRDTSSGTYETFHKLVMKKAAMAAGVEYASSNAQVKARVVSTVGAISYVGLGYVDAKVRALAVDGVKPSRKTVAGGLYPVSRPLFMFTNGFPKLGSAAHAFVTFHLSEAGQEVIERQGFVPVTDY